ncbi:MAG: PQQ-binding-like beta-propeller repeat protein [Elusimicrobiota bacterium]
MKQTLTSVGGRRRIIPALVVGILVCLCTVQHGWTEYGSFRWAVSKDFLIVLHGTKLTMLDRETGQCRRVIETHMQADEQSDLVVKHPDLAIAFLLHRSSLRHGDEELRAVGFNPHRDMLWSTPVKWSWDFEWSGYNQDIHSGDDYVVAQPIERAECRGLCPSVTEEEAQTKWTFLSTSTLHILARATFSYSRAVAGKHGIYSVDERKISFIDARTGDTKWSYANEWGKGPIQYPEEIGQFLFFRQDGEVYMLDRNGKLEREFSQSHVAANNDGTLAYLVSTNTVTAVNAVSGETEWTFNLVPYIPWTPAKIRYRASEVGDILVTPDALIIGQSRFPVEDIAPARYPRRDRYVAIHPEKGTALPIAANPALHRTDNDGTLVFVGYSGKARRIMGILPSADAMFFPEDARSGTFHYIDIKSGQFVRPDLPAQPVLSDGQDVFIWNENNGALYAYRYPNWTRGKDIWRSTKSSWECDERDKQAD